MYLLRATLFVGIKVLLLFVGIKVLLLFVGIKVLLFEGIVIYVILTKIEY